MSNHLQFPILNEGQFAALFCDINSGVILNHELKYHVDSNENPYYIFSSLEEAKTFCQKAITSNNTIEYHIYDYKEKHVQ